MYALLQAELGHIGRFQKGTNNVLRFIVSDIEGIKSIIQLVHGKLRTPKNLRFVCRASKVHGRQNPPASLRT